MASGPMKSSRFATRPDATCIVLVPDLESLFRESAGKPALIRRLTRRAAPRQLDPAGFQGELAIGRPVPPAALTRRLDQPDDADGYWLRADPIDLSADLGAVWLHPGVPLDPDSAPARELVALFAEEGLDLDFPTPERGYIRLAEPVDCHFSPPWALAGESMENLLPTGGDARRWRRLLNETQVMLHQHRAESGPNRPPGSLWFWGGGALPERSGIEPRISTIAGDDPIMLGLADWLELEQMSARFEESPRPGLMMTWAFDYSLDAETNLEQLDAWIRRAWRRLRLDRRFEALEIVDDSRCWRFTTGDAWRMWR